MLIVVYDNHPIGWCQWYLCDDDPAVFADPDERNSPSRRVLEKNGFQLLAIKSIPSELTDDPMAVYRLLPGAGVSASGRLTRDRSRARFP